MGWISQFSGALRLRLCEINSSNMASSESMQFVSPTPLSASAHKLRRAQPSQWLLRVRDACGVGAMDDVLLVLTTIAWSFRQHYLKYNANRATLVRDRSLGQVSAQRVRFPLSHVGAQA